MVLTIGHESRARRSLLLVAVPLRHDDRHLPVEFATPRAREIAKPVLELLSGVPTIVYGYLRPAVRHADPAEGHPSLPGLQPSSRRHRDGIMIVPLVASISEDAMRACRCRCAKGSFAMGATRLQTGNQCRRPGCDLGHRRGLHLGISRAVGGDDDPRRGRGMTAEPDVQPARARPRRSLAFIVQVALGDCRLASHGSVVLPDESFAGRPHRSVLFCSRSCYSNLIGLWMRNGDSASLLG